MPHTHTMVKMISLPNTINIVPSINYLINHHNNTAKSWLVCFFWGLFPRAVRNPWVLRCPLNATGWIVQVAMSSLLLIIICLIDDISYGISYILWHFEATRPYFNRGIGRHLGMGGYRCLTGLICMAKIQFLWGNWSYKMWGGSLPTSSLLQSRPFRLENLWTLL